jgi:thiamine kinase-like enzyme
VASYPKITHQKDKRRHQNAKNTHVEAKILSKKEMKRLIWSKWAQAKEQEKMAFDPQCKKKKELNQLHEKKLQYEKEYGVSIYLVRHKRGF